MANKSTLPAEFFALNDGSSSTYTINLNVQPIIIQTFFQLSSAPLNISAITSIGGVVRDDGSTGSVVSYGLGILTVTFPTVLAAGVISTIAIYIQF